jgi:hypothetical protein
MILILLLIQQIGQAQIISTIAGNGTGGDGGLAASAAIYDPGGLVFDSQYNLYFDEHLGNRIRKIDRSGIISTVAGTGSGGYNGDGIQATTAKLKQPAGLAFDIAGNLYIADLANNRIRKIDFATGIITTVCGNGAPTSTGDGNPATAATTAYPQGICIDKHGNMFIAELNRLRKINTSGIISTVAGDGSLGETGDGGPASAAKVSAVWVDVDYEDNIYVTGQYVIRLITPAGTISTIAGNPSSGYYDSDNISATAVHLEPTIVKFNNESKTLYVSDAYNDRVRIIGIDGIIHTFAGNGVGGFGGDGGRPDSAQTNHPSGIAFDSCGNVYFGQVDNPRIRKITYPHCGYLETPQLPTATTFTLYPNPVVDYLYLNNTPPGQYTITDMSGRVLRQGELSAGSNTIPMGGMAAGVYMIELSTEDGKREVRKVVKE